MLLNCNALSVNRLKIAGEDFRKHTKMLNEMKKDLDYIFKKVRVIKTKLSGQYPEAFDEVSSQNRNSIAEEADEDSIPKISEPSTSSSKQQSETPKLHKHHQSESVKPTIDYVQMNDHQSSSDTDRNSTAFKRSSLKSNQSSSSTDNSTSSESDIG